MTKYKSKTIFIVFTAALITLLITDFRPSLFLAYEFANNLGFKFFRFGLILVVFYLFLKNSESICKKIKCVIEADDEINVFAKKLFIFSLIFRFFFNLTFPSYILPQVYTLIWFLLTIIISASIFVLIFKKKLYTRLKKRG